MDDPFGAPVGKLTDPDGAELKNEFSNITSRDITLESDRILPRQMGVGVMRGTQRIVNTDGSFITLGVIPDTNGEFGIGFFDNAGELTKVSSGDHDYYYDDDGNVTVAINRIPGIDQPIIIVVKDGYDALESVSS